MFVFLLLCWFLGSAACCGLAPPVESDISINRGAASQNKSPNVYYPAQIRNLEEDRQYYQAKKQFPANGITLLTIEYPENDSSQRNRNINFPQIEKNHSEANKQNSERNAQN